MEVRLCFLFRIQRLFATEEKHRGTNMPTLKILTTAFVPEVVSDEEILMRPRLVSDLQRDPVLDTRLCPTKATMTR